jgi:riboflavin kinase/FMN adenylyltransferase
MNCRRISDSDECFGPTAVTIGNFDGVHAAHRHIMGRVVLIAAANGWKPTVLTFDPHPMRVVAPDRAPRLLTTPEQRCALMREQGIEQTLVLPFTSEIARLTPEEFVRQILVEKLGAKAVLVGENFRFGARAAGDTAMLAALGAKYGFKTETVGPVLWRRRMVSSSEIRRLIQAGNVGVARRMLQRPYCVEGDVVRGHGVGAKQTVPTLNLDTDAEVLPAVGVYITRTRDLDDQREWNSITNIGHRPTFGGDERISIETFLLTPLTGETPAHIRVEFLRRVREERKFENAEALKTQIMRDAARAQAYFRRISVSR